MSLRISTSNVPAIVFIGLLCLRQTQFEIVTSRHRSIFVTSRHRSIFLEIKAAQNDGECVTVERSGLDDSDHNLHLNILLCQEESARFPMAMIQDPSPGSSDSSH